MEMADLLLHPVRLRVVHALSGGNLMTTAEICARMPDVSKTSAYRHIGLLADAGVLGVESERRVRGAVERTYRLCRERAVLATDPERTAEDSTEEYRRGFAAATAVLLAEFGTYLDRADADPVADLVGFRQHALWLSRDELDSLIGDLRAAIAPRTRHGPAPGRTQHLLSPVLFPMAGAPAVRDAPGTPGDLPVQGRAEG
ncbi:helix-turn-helix domain-containing protein [Streptomyces sp. NPDC004111]|uniref:helix-turn-helix domain-containing protein n=1 Tax=Streptomyces sp. NPDC004111 TaxID=3364690 RepID=UPI0036A4C6CF